MLNRSIDRDYDIGYHNYGFKRTLEELKWHIRSFRYVGYEPTEQLVEMGELWKTLTDESDYI